MPACERPLSRDSLEQLLEDARALAALVVWDRHAAASLNRRYFRGPPCA